jgi:pantoate--beta-alanine ligase
MKHITNIKDFFKFRKSITPNLKIGVVPTMGHLHKAHLSLINNARSQCDIVVTTIFVNEIQFNNKEDFLTYPQNIPSDIQLIENSKPSDCQTMDVIFTPSSLEMYPNINKMTKVMVEKIDNSIEGKSRPGHFTGVATVVSKLFNIIRPDIAYFGQKDAIQCILIKRLANEMNYPIDIVIGETMREFDGLAMSSRNSKLSKEERELSPFIYKVLKNIQTLFEQNPKISSRELITFGVNEFNKENRMKIEYISISNFNGEEVEFITDSAILSCAVFVGKTRLIDNIILKLE